jgi:hypothetical protein
MPPPCLRGVQQIQLGGTACRKQQRWQLDQSEDEHEDADADIRPGKLQRTLSICRTKSVPAGLDQVLLEAASAANTAAAVDAVVVAAAVLQSETAAKRRNQLDSPGMCCC